jgi:signal recognition particle receptor subunit beta
VLLNVPAREIHAKIVYYGPGLGGKTTNLLHLHGRLPDHARGRMISIATENERTLFFDFLPIDLGQVRGFRVRFHLYTVPGQGYYAASRRVILRGVDGVVFVADSDRRRLLENLESFDDLLRNLRGERLAPERIPLVMQWNKRDLSGAVPAAHLEALLNLYRAPSFEAVATTGHGVVETLKACCGGVLRSIENGQSAALPAPPPARMGAPGPARAAAPTRRPPPLRAAIR